MPNSPTAPQPRLRPIWSALAVLVVVSAFFVLVPEADLATSRAFYVVGEGFPVARDPFWRDVRELGMFATKVLNVSLVAILIFKLTKPEVVSAVSARALLFLAAVQALGPGLIVNGVLKEFWGRARPRQTDVFGGEHGFTGAWEIVSNCATNCSFTSGEAASSFALVAVALVLPQRMRIPALLAALAWATVMSVNRIAFGGHFLSDVVISWAIVAALIVGLKTLILDRPGPEFDARLENWLAAPRRRIMRHGDDSSASGRES